MSDIDFRFKILHFLDATIHTRRLTRRDLVLNSCVNAMSCVEFVCHFYVLLWNLCVISMSCFELVCECYFLCWTRVWMLSCVELVYECMSCVELVPECYVLCWTGVCYVLCWTRVWMLWPVLNWCVNAVSCVELVCGCCVLCWTGVWMLCPVLYSYVNAMSYVLLVCECYVLCWTGVWMPCNRQAPAGRRQAEQQSMEVDTWSSQTVSWRYQWHPDHLRHWTTGSCWRYLRNWFQASTNCSLLNEWIQSWIVEYC